MPSRLQNGVYTLQVAVCDSSDYPMGQLITPNSPVFGTVYSPYVVPAPVEYAVAADTIESAYSFAAQRQRGRRELGVSQLGDGTVTLAEFDSTFDALVGGGTLDTTSSAALEIATHNVNRSTPRRLMLGFTAAATPANSLTNYDTIWTWGTLRRGALGVNQASGRNPNNRTYTLTKTLSTRTPWGQLFSQSTVNPNGSSDDEVVIYGDAPIMLATYVGDGTASAVTLPYAPEYATGASGLVYRNGTASAQAVGSITSVTLKLIAAGIGISGDKWVFGLPSVSLLTS